MPVPDISGLPPFADFEMVVKKFNELVQKYNNLLVNMDSLNVISLTADHIDAGTLDANIVTIRSDLTNGYIQIDGTGLIVNNGLFNTFTVDINGNVTMTSALVQSAFGYPKVELNSAQNLMAAYADHDTYVAFIPAGTGQQPQLVFVDGGMTRGFLVRSLGGTTLGTIGESLNLQAGAGLQIDGVNGVTSGFWASSVPSGPADMFVAFAKGIRTQ